MGLISVSDVADGTGIDATDLNTRVNAIVNEVNGSLSSANLANNAVTTAKITDDSVTDAKLDYPRWWKEIARTTLSGAADTITVSSIPAFNYLRIIYYGIATGGTLDAFLRFNSDSGASYAWQGVNNGAFSSGTSGTSHPLDSSAVVSGQSGTQTIEIVNYAAREKVGTFQAATVTATGAATAPFLLSGTLKWINTAAQISTITATNSGTGDFAIGSEVIVLGAN